MVHINDSIYIKCSPNYPQVQLPPNGVLSSPSHSPTQDCPALWSCPALLGARGEPAPDTNLPVALVVATAVILVFLAIVVAAVVYR